MMRDPDRANFAGVTAITLAGLLIWSVHFLVIYGFTGLACARGFAADRVLGFSLVDVTVVGTTIVALLAAGAVLLRALRLPHDAGRSAPFLRWTAAMCAVLAMIAIVWEGLPALLISGCR